MPYITHQEVREQAGFQYKERSVTLTPATGDGSNKTFYVALKPIVDSNYSGTPVTIADVAVYVSGTPVVVSVINASLGRIGVSAAPTSGSPITGDYDWSNLSDTIIEIYLKEAHDLILSKLSEVYNLPLSYVPPIVELIEKKLTAGLLLDKEYSGGGEGTEDTRGRRWVKWAEKKLEDIVSGALDLLDASGAVLSQRSTDVGLEGWPDNTTEDAAEDDAGGGIAFRRKKEF